MIILHKVLYDELMLDTCRNVCTRKYGVHEIRHIRLLGRMTKQHEVEVFHASVAAVTDCSYSQAAVTTVCMYYYTVLEVWRPGIRTQFH